MAGTIDPTFRKITAAMRRQGDAAAKAIENKEPFKGEVYGSEGEVDPRDPDSIKQFFDRSKVEQQYVKTIENPSPQNGVNVAIAAKLQADFLAQCERDFKMQHNATRVRSRCHYAARRLSHGHEDGPVAKGIVYLPYSYLKLEGGS